MPPLVHVVSVLVLSVGIADASTASLLCAGAMLAAGMLASGVAPLHTIGVGVLRLKYFYLALLVMYGWLQPGTALMANAGGWSPTAEGLVEGLHRAGMLMVMLAAVVWMMQVQGRERLLAGLIQLGRPLAWFGCPVERFALRLLLALDVLPRLDAMAHRHRGADVGAGRADFRARLRAAARRAAALWRDTLEMAENEPPARVRVPQLPWPRWWQWLAPLLIAAIFYMV